jgi:predicted Zn-dependent protease
MSKLSRRAFLSLAGPAVMLPGAWLRAEEPRVVNQPYNTLSEEEEIELGRKFAAELEKKVEILDAPEIQSYANRIVKRLGAASQRPEWPFQAKVVNTAQVNAFAIPGGSLYVNRGLLEFVEDENELAGVLAHEVGHVVARHTTNQLVLNFIARHLFEQVKRNIFLNNDVIARLIEALGGPVYMLAQLQYSRENESEADMLGFYEMLRAGWNPVGLSRFFTRLAQRTGPSNPLSVMLSDHPASSDRAAAVRREMQEVNVTAPAVMKPAAFHSMKEQLEDLPPAPRARE